MARPAKRRASSPSHAKHRMSIATPVYSTKEPTLEEKLTLPERFQAADAWPILKIVAERAGKYQVEWEPHPKTGEIWKPEWRKPADVGDEHIANWKEQQRTEKKGLQIPTNSAGGANASRGDWEEEGSSKRRRLARRIVLSDTSVRTTGLESITSTSPQTPITRKRQSRLPILSSSSPTTEIQETQQQSLSTTDSIQVNVPEANHFNREEYQTIPNSSASLEISSSNHFPTSSTKDQEADSALGLSSPIGDGSGPPSASFLDSEDPEASETTDSRFSLPTSHRHTSSAETSDSRAFKEGPRPASRLATSSLVLASDPIEQTPNSVNLREAGELVYCTTNTAASSPLFFPDAREQVPESNADVVASLTASQDTARSQIVDTRTQRPELHTIPSKTSTDLLPITGSGDSGENTNSQRPEAPVFATPHPVLRRSSVRGSVSQDPTVITREVGANGQLSPRPSTKSASAITQPPPVTPPRQVPRARLFQRLNLGISPNKRAGSLESMSARERESSPRVRRSAPPVEPGAPSLSLRESLIKSTAPARALQQARHERAAHRSTSRATSTTTDSTRNSIPARTANPSPINAQGDMRSSLSSNRAFDASGAFSSLMQVDDAEPALVSSISPAISVYNSALGSSALPLHPSIEDEQSLPQVTRPSLPSSPILGRGEYVIPLPAEGKIKDHYLECIRGKRRTLMKFTRHPRSTGRANNSRVNAEEAEQMRRLLDRLNDTTTHLDLGLEGPATQYSDSSVNEATWTYYASSKFAFLYHLIESLRHQDCSIAIIAREGLTLDLLEKYMKANHVNYRRSPGFDAASTQGIEGSTGRIQVNLIAWGSNLERGMTGRPALIMAFDTSFDAQDAQVRQIREQFGADRPLIPVVYPMIINSAEHVDICIPKSMPSPQRFQMVIQTTFRARDSLGGDPVIVTSPSATGSPSSMNPNAFVALKKSLGKRFTLIAEAVARAAVSDNFDANLVIPPAVLELEPQSDPSSGLNTADSTSPQSRVGTPSVQKRLLETDSASSISSKRQRRSPFPDATHVSDSIKDSQTRIEDLREVVGKAEENLARERQARSAAEEALAGREKQLEEIKSSLGHLQTRYESRMKSCHQLKREAQKAQMEKESVEKKQDKLSAEILGWSARFTQLRVELTEAREALKAGGGSVADVEVAQEEVRKLRERNVALEKSNANMRKDFEFTRSQYQDASTKAAEFAMQVSELESQMTELKRQASDEKRRLKEINHKKEVEQHLARIVELELVLKQRDTILQRKEEELKAVKKGRGVATRGSSVQPASPRAGGSRGGSPAPGLLTPATYAVSRASALRHER